MVDKAGLRHSAEAGQEGVQTEGAAPPIHVPGPSIWPAVLGLGVALLLFGVLSTWVFSLAGLIVFVWALAMWISQLRDESAQHDPARHESEGAPLDHDAHA